MTDGAVQARPAAGGGVTARSVLAGLLVALWIGSCGPTAPAPAASSSAPASVRPSRVPGPPGLDWSQAAAVDRPAGMDATPPSISPVGSGGGLGHPGHFSGQGNPFDVAAVGDRLVAVGYTFPGFHGVTWTSTDRQAWMLTELPGATDAAFPTTVAAGLTGGAAGGRVVIGGRVGNDAAAWTGDGASWARVDGGDAFREAPETRLSAIVAAPTGFVAGGWAGVITQPGRPRFWTSADGMTWTRMGDSTSDENGRVVAIAAGPGGFVAVGTTGPLGPATGSAVWHSADGTSWERIDVPDLRGGRMRAVTAGSAGFIAVGADLDETAAAVWRSRDGLAWERVPTQDSLTYHGLGITMSDVVAGPTGTLVAVGHFLFGQQYGQGTAWTSEDDGRTWTRMPDAAAFGQGEPLAVIADGAGYVAVGTVGAPDNFIPTVWLSPSR